MTHTSFGTQPDPRPLSTDAGVAEALRYLQTGGLGEVAGLAVQSKDIGAAKVQMDTDMAIALCKLAVPSQADASASVSRLYGEFRAPDTSVVMHEAPAMLIAEINMKPIGAGLPVRDELRGEQTILTYNENVGTWDIAFCESGWGDFDAGFALGVSHWLDISSMWPGVIAQVASFPAPSLQVDAGATPDASIFGWHRYAVEASVQELSAWIDSGDDLSAVKNEVSFGESVVTLVSVVARMLGQAQEPK